MIAKQIVGIGCLVALSGMAAAGGFEPRAWVGGVGDWGDPANWADGLVPGAGDVVLVLNGGTALATGVDQSVNSAIFGGAFGAQSGDGGLVQSGGMFSWANHVQFGAAQGTTGTLDLTNGASWSSGTLALGRNGTGVGVIGGASQLFAPILTIGGDRTPARGFTSHGDLTVTGVGTVVQAVTGAGQGRIHMGLDGSAAVRIADGAVVETNQAILGSTTAAGSSMTIEGDGSAFRFGGAPDTWFDLGRDITLTPDHPPVGPAVLTLRDGGRVEQTGASRGMTLADGSLVQGSGELRTSVTNLQGSVINPGEGASFGHLRIERLLDNQTGFGGGTLRFDLGGTADTLHDRLTVGGLLAGGTLEIALAAGFDPVFGDAFDIITILDQPFYAHDQAMGVFETVVLPALSGGLFFEVGYAETGVSLTVVPGPGAGVVLCVGLLGTAGRRRPAAST
ncbi:MAG: hypothetical protein LAT64_04430 [Phycisphaerales bacterium]|nr:hypothetical protein [Planctomycetota bacterium]MCH8508000.1 hypothetical protein [Phycisphaerales bacterium]